jgi:glycosyltransferase involved in cell wall biosynthesis
MRVLHVITALGVGGAERMLLKLLGARALGRCRQEVIAMLPGPMGASMRATGAQVHELNFLGGVPLIGGSVGLVQAARKFDPDVVQGWLYHGNLGAALARRSLHRRVPLVWGIRQSLASLEGENWFARVGIALNKMGSAHPDRLLFNSRTSLAQHSAFGFLTERADYLPNGFDTTNFRPDLQARARWRAAWNIDDDTVVYGMFARFHPSKDHASFLAAAARVRAERPASRFVLAGTGVDIDNPALARAVQEAGLVNHVHLIGERHDVAGVLPALDVYVSSSIAIEAFSNSVGEAMCCGLPTIVTNVGDSPLVVANTGRVVPPADPDALTAAMVSMHDLGRSGRAELGAQARRRVVSEFDIEAVAGRYASLYDLLTDPEGGAH